MSKYESSKDSIQQIDTGGESLEWTQNAISMVEDTGAFKTMKFKPLQRGSISISIQQPKQDSANEFDEDFERSNQFKKKITQSNLLESKIIDEREVPRSLRSSLSSMELDDHLNSLKNSVV